MTWNGNVWSSRIAGMERAADNVNSQQSQQCSGRRSIELPVAGCKKLKFWEADRRHMHTHNSKPPAEASAIYAHWSHPDRICPVLLVTFGALLIVLGSGCNLAPPANPGYLRVSGETSSRDDHLRRRYL